jgi:hypothetical protein
VIEEDKVVKRAFAMHLAHGKKHVCIAADSLHEMEEWLTVLKGKPYTASTPSAASPVPPLSSAAPSTPNIPTAPTPAPIPPAPPLMSPPPSNSSHSLHHSLHSLHPFIRYINSSQHSILTLPFATLSFMFQNSSSFALFNKLHHQH